MPSGPWNPGAKHQMNATGVPGGGRTLYRYRFGTAEYDESRRELRVDGSIVELEPKPLEMLAFLLAHTGQPVSRRQLLDAVWRRRPAVDNVVGNTVMKLRRALGPDNARRIVTLPRIGLRIDEPVERIAIAPPSPGSLTLTPGMRVPLRPNWVLERRLGGTSDASEIWLARQVKTGRNLVYRFAAGELHAGTLKRELTLYRLLRESLPQVQSFVDLVDWNFAEPPFFVETGYAGESLADWAQRERHLAAMPDTQRIALFLQIADAVAAAHAVGILHQDLRPAHVLLQARTDGIGWDVRLKGFGGLRLADADIGSADGPQAVDTTAPYVAPERIAGGNPTLQSDLYALGVILYQMLVGDLSRPLASGWERDIDDPLLQADIAKAVCENPAHRLSSVAELAARLRTLEARRLEKQEHLQRAPGTVVPALQTGRFRRRQILVAVAMILAMVALAGSLGFWTGTRQTLGNTECLQKQTGETSHS